MAKYTCERCGKLRNLAHGTFTSWGELYRPPKFFCNRCLNIMEKEEADKKLRKFLDIADSAKQMLKFKDELKQSVITVIKNVCTQPDWYQLKGLTERVDFKPDVRKVSNILNELGFTQRARKRHGSYTYVFINITLLKV